MANLPVSAGQRGCPRLAAKPQVVGTQKQHRLAANTRVARLFVWCPVFQRLSARGQTGQPAALESQRWIR